MKKLITALVFLPAIAAAQTQPAAPAQPACPQLPVKITCKAGLTRTASQTNNQVVQGLSVNCTDQVNARVLVLNIGPANLGGKKVLCRTGSFGLLREKSATVCAEKEGIVYDTNKPFWYEILVLNADTGENITEGGAISEMIPKAASHAHLTQISTDSPAYRPGKTPHGTLTGFGFNQPIKVTVIDEDLVKEEGSKLVRFELINTTNGKVLGSGMANTGDTFTFKAEHNYTKKVLVADKPENYYTTGNLEKGRNELKFKYWDAYADANKVQPTWSHPAVTVDVQY